MRGKDTNIIGISKMLFKVFVYKSLLSLFCLLFCVYLVSVIIFLILLKAMKYLKFFFVLGLAAAYVSFGFAADIYRDDELGHGLVCRTIDMGRDYEGDVVCTLVERPAPVPSDRGVLYLHGFNDYFFQVEMADRFNAEGYNFYALDLRKHGRSLRHWQRHCNLRDVSEFYADIDTALSIMADEGCRDIVLLAHSTGGLIASLYCNDNRDDLRVDALILNSPFLELNMGWFMRKIAMPVVAVFSRMAPDFMISQGVSTGYGESLLKGYHGEWIYDTDKKCMVSPDVSAGWVGGIYRAQKRVKEGLDIPCPVMVMYSDSSVVSDVWVQKMQRADAVLNVEDIAVYGRRLGKTVDLVRVKGGMHDLLCSAPGVRKAVYGKIFEWLHCNKTFARFFESVRVLPFG